MQVTIKNFKYAPGGKWECGILHFDAETPLGPVTWRETIPGPRHGSDSAKLEFKLNGKELSDEVEPPDFEPPNKDGKRADKFRESGELEIAEELGAWLDAYKEDME